MFPQANESYSRAGVIPGLHSVEPFMGKLVRTVRRRMINLVLDIRLGSPTFAKIVAYEMPAGPDVAWSEWISVPPGFAHGNFFPEETVIEYLCTGEYSPGCEAAVSPLAPDLDWTLCPRNLREMFETMVEEGATISDKVGDAGSLADWRADPHSHEFLYSELAGSDA